MSADTDGMGCLVLIVLLGFGVYGIWGQGKKWLGISDACPRVLSAQPSDTASGISYGPDKSPILTADIVSAVAECIPPDSTSKSNPQYYSIAVTANVSYKAKDGSLAYGRKQDKVIFECQTENNVVLGSGEAKFAYVNGGKAGTISTKITGLTSEEVKKLKTVKVRWAYD